MPLLPRNRTCLWDSVSRRPWRRAKGQGDDPLGQIEVAAPCLKSQPRGTLTIMLGPLRGDRELVTTVDALLACAGGVVVAFGLGGVRLR